MKKALFSGALLACLYLTLEIAAMVGLFAIERLVGIRYQPIERRLSAESRKEIRKMIEAGGTYWAHDPLLGWTVKPNGVSKLAQSNSHGIRASREFSLERPAGSFRISTFGDSFTHGNEVRTEDTFQEVLMRKNRHLEVLNFGVAGYGLDQAMLRYRRDGVRFASDVVLIGFMSENIFRSVSVFRPFYTHGGPPLAKPRYTLVGHDLILLKNPLPQLEDYARLLANEDTELELLGRNDFYFKTALHEGPADFLPSVRIFKLLKRAINRRLERAGVVTHGIYNVASPAFPLTVRIFDAFRQLVLDDGAVPVILIFPGKVDLQQESPRYAPLLEHFRANGYHYIDPRESLQNSTLDRESLFMERGHYSPLANQVVAEAILEYLGSIQILPEHREDASR